jgi:hypothetical protein
MVLGIEDDFSECGSSRMVMSFGGDILYLVKESAVGGMTGNQTDAQ